MRGRGWGIRTDSATVPGAARWRPHPGGMGEGRPMSADQSGEAPRILLRVEDGVAVATLNRPEVLNAVDGSMRTALARLLEQVESDDSIRALVLTGAGRGF